MIESISIVNTLHGGSVSRFRCAEGFVLQHFLSWEILGFPDDLRQMAVLPTVES